MSLCRFTVLSSASLALLINASSHAEDAEPVIVTATRTAQTADSALASVTVITRQEIEQSQAKTVEGLLAGREGIDISTSGAYGKTTSLFLRGTNTGHTLILIDGMKVGSATSGTTSIELLPLDQIDHIEIVRGPRSSLYGSEAIGGVIQIFTRQPGTGAHVQTDTGFGSNSTARLAIAANQSSDATRFSISGSALQTDGINARVPGKGTFPTDEPDNDGYSNASLSLRLEHDISSNLTVGVNLLHSEGDTHYDGFYNSTDFVNQVSSLNLDYAVNSVWQSKLTLGESQDRTDNFSSGVFASKFDTRRQNLSWQNDFTFAKRQILTVGADYLNDHVVSDTAYNKTKRDNTGVFAQYQSYIDKHDYLLSVRRDHNQAFGNKTTGNIAWGYAWNEQLRLTASYGTAFKAPTFNDLYYPGYSNPNLQPETSNSIEAGVRITQNWGNVAISAYQTNIDHLIALDSSYIPFNVDQAKINGIELGTQMHFGDWHSAAELTWLNPRDKATNKILQRRARNTAKFDLDRTLGHWQIGATLTAQGERYDDTSNTTRLGGYGTLDLRGETAVSKHVKVQGSVKNVADKQYETAYSYNMLGRTWFINLIYQE